MQSDKGLSYLYGSVVSSYMVVSLYPLWSFHYYSEITIFELGEMNGETC